MRFDPYSLGSVLADAKHKGFTGIELVAIQHEYVAAAVAWEQNNPVTSGCDVLSYLEQKALAAYSAAEQYKQKVIDNWHKS